MLFTKEEGAEEPFQIIAFAISHARILDWLGEIMIKVTAVKSRP